jgi:hypothetical protein
MTVVMRLFIVASLGDHALFTGPRGFMASSEFADARVF